jgi:hypothetical protein
VHEVRKLGVLDVQIRVRQIDARTRIGDKPPRRHALRPIVVNGPTTERAGRPLLEKRFDLHSRGKGSICPLTLPLNKVESAIE